MKKDTVEMLHKVYEKLEEQNEIELLAELKQFVKNVKHTECLLTRGGIIQDRNGKFCSAGDYVKIKVYPSPSTDVKEEFGMLHWIDNGFVFKGEDTEICRVFSCNIEKVE